ncbi:MAG: hypothetical protein JWO91_2060 [Acidobacteriaceae bacterium]|nr:hypothetical protein [Acidobacteriaceae bacterium]
MLMIAAVIAASSRFTATSGINERSIRTADLKLCQVTEAGIASSEIVNR